MLEQIGSPTTTHPETAWLVGVVPTALTMAILLVVLLLLRERLAITVLKLRSRRAAARRALLPPGLVPDAALLWVPPDIPPGPFVGVCAGVCLVVVAAVSLVAPLYLAVMGLGPVTVLLVWVLLRFYQHRYVTALDRELTTAVGRLSALLQSGNGFRQALSKLVAAMEPGPLREEWSFLLERQGAPLVVQAGIATPQQVVAALSTQTPSRRHATLLNHLAVAVGQPQDVLRLRVASVYQALQAADRRKEEANTELAQMRYSGIAVGLAGLLMAGYLVLTQWERVVVAYSSPAGLLVAPVVLGALLLPIVGGYLLAQAEELDS